MAVHLKAHPEIQAAIQVVFLLAILAVPQARVLLAILVVFLLEILAVLLAWIHLGLLAWILPVILRLILLVVLLELHLQVLPQILRAVHPTIHQAILVGIQATVLLRSPAVVPVWILVDLPARAHREIRASRLAASQVHGLARVRRAVSFQVMRLATPLH